MLKKGLKSDDVRDIQIKLKEIGLYNFEIDSFYGEETEKSVIEFQNDTSRLVVTGIVDEWTRLELETAFNN
jgi:peptidoglycan hydrolase-like protein with peptidoglycan-binding domain